MLKTFMLVLNLFAVSPLIVAAQTVELDIDARVADGADSDKDDYVTWAPTFCRARLDGASGPGGQQVELINQAGGGDVLFEAIASSWPANKTATKQTLVLQLPNNGDWREFVIAGKFGAPSTKDRDTIIEARLNNSAGAVLGTEDLMVRVRKNALKLDADERKRYLTAVDTLNDMGEYGVFQQMHAIAGQEAHGGPAFLPWHRAEILQYERALQEIDPSVALPYWKFDEAAAALFAADYMGANGDPVPNGWVEVDFDGSNPLAGWMVQSQPLLRRPNPRNVDPPTVQNDNATLNPSDPAQFSSFTDMEGAPHGDAHVWVGGWMGSVPTAVRDPLFFMLHCNCDRLWAQWQRERNRFNKNNASSYHAQGATPARIGHNVADTMWPWNDANGAPRPATAPGEPFDPATPFTLGPPKTPTPGDEIDYAGHADPEKGQGFCYDSVPYGI